MTDSRQDPPPAQCASTEPSSLWHSVYQELRGLAAKYLAHERSSHTLQPTALVHEAFLRLQPHRGLPRFNRLEFFRAAASAMQRILVDHARHHLRQKRQGPTQCISQGDTQIVAPTRDAASLLDMETALQDLERVSARRAEIVRLRFFAGLSEQETADLLQVSKRTVQYEFRSARAWLRSVLDTNEDRENVGTSS